MNVVRIDAFKISIGNDTATRYAMKNMIHTINTGQINELLTAQKLETSIQKIKARKIQVKEVFGRYSFFFTANKREIMPNPIAIANCFSTYDST